MLTNPPHCPIIAPAQLCPRSGAVFLPAVRHYPDHFVSVRIAGPNGPKLGGESP